MSDGQTALLIVGTEILVPIAVFVAFQSYAGLVRLCIWATEPGHQQMIDEFDLQIALAKARTPVPEPTQEVVSEPKPPA